ncbi:thiolase family protein [Fusibacter paucivorans]|uniref:acetyl-CoA C-acyltransferase n=1 Tax=Fusibacter paucivorans TaxID=76009 RepID=A0ABS5PTD3_9FIRM|nr:thiolase family protein [Fusibacter paucivorans]MBS7528348.1 thiolase family protein [Fusibacter paucivorans]
MKEAVIVSYARSAVGKANKGTLKQTRPDDLAAQVLNGLLERVPQVSPIDVDDFILGCATTEGPQGMNLAKIVLDRAGLPYEIPGQTVNRFCSSGLQAIAAASNAIAVGTADIIIAGGVESMSMVPSGGNAISPNPWLIDNRPGAYMPMGITAENVAKRYHVSREAQDEWAYKSNMRAVKAIAEGKFENEIVPVEAEIISVDENGSEISEKVIFTKDEGPRATTTIEKLGSLFPVFDMDGSVTAGNSSQVSDGAAMVMVMSSEKADALGLLKIAKLIAFAVAGVEAEYMGIGPIEAVPKALKQAGLTMDDIDLVELNEAFASQVVPCIETLKMDPEKVNVNGGAIALGHPMGATGAWLTMKALEELKRRGGKYGLVTMCIGGGMGAAGIFEML